MLIQKTAHIEIDVDIADFSSEEIVAEVKRRGLVTGIPRLEGEERHPLHDVYYALKYGSDATALELLKSFLSDELGVVL